MPLTRVRLVRDRRTHQLRIHAASGWATPSWAAISWRPAAARLRAAPRLMLHASALDFVHPVSGEPMQIRCEALGEALAAMTGQQE